MITQELIAECIVCGANIEFESNVELNELVDCFDCTTEYEVVGVSPIHIQEAPMEAEDWGQ
ncbi:MAG: lysine biosynthesis protein LysW [Candidatus Kariarchaeaceae archaeon]|jgi:lysine biosynthesis protein LysW